MPVDPDRVLAATIPDTTHTWDPDDVILYHLGVGAGDPPTDPGELEYVYEANLKVLPSFATIPMFASMMHVLSLDGLDINPAMMLHAEQAISLAQPIPTSATVTNRTSVAGLYDTGKGAVVVLDIVSSSGGEELFRNTVSLYVRGEGGFGGEPVPPPGNTAPGREPDHVVESVTLPQQSLLYRLSGDRNPLHADPAFAALAGFERPILHGLCSFGIVCRAVVDGALGGDVGTVDSFSVRFSGVVFPGETIVTSMWDEGERWIVEASTAERGSSVITNAAMGVRSSP